jgi:hypothetical protein
VSMETIKVGDGTIKPILEAMKDLPDDLFD